MKNKKRVGVVYAESLSDIYDDISAMVAEMTENAYNPILWFRGHEYANYNLNPNIFRNSEYHYNDTQMYSNNHLREEYRFQNFMSRNFDNIDYRMPQSIIEWQEIMQHFFAKTRLMDWSESITVALEFALEAFLMPNDDLEIKERKKQANPVIWILNPAELNRQVYDSFLYKANGRYPLIQKALDGNLHSGRLDCRIGAELRKEKAQGTYYDMKRKEERNMNFMVSLSALELLRNTYRGRESEALQKMEMNPFFYLLLRFYSDGIPVKMGDLPPLAIIHPYHSQRIRMQKGAFTVFPFYIPDETMEKIEKITGKKVPIGMEYMPECIPYLHQIHIMNPQGIAKELLTTGGKRGNIYPEMQTITQDMESYIEY